MEQAATVGEGRAALAMKPATDPATLARVLAALLGQLGGTLPVMPLQPAVSAYYLDRRTVTPLRHVRAGGGPVTCFRCGLADPPPEMTCWPEMDHFVGWDDGCPACGRLMPACARRPCFSMMRGTR